MSIAVCTPTYNRRWTWEWSRMCFDGQDYPADKLTWIVVDNSDDPEKDWSVSESHPRVKYIRVDGKRPIGELRNICAKAAVESGADYMAFWDDDDFYVPHRLSHAIKVLNENPTCEYAGCSLLYLLLIRENVLLKVGPYSENHSTAASWVVRMGYVAKNSFDPKAVRGEEASFMRHWRTKMYALKPEDTILVMGHSGNTVDKSQVRKKAAQFLSTDVNSANGKMVARLQWFRTPEVWAQFQSTFSGASSAKPLGST